MIGGSPFISYGGAPNTYDCSTRDVVLILVAMYVVYYYLLTPSVEYFAGRNGDNYDEPHLGSQGSRFIRPREGSGYGAWWETDTNKKHGSFWDNVLGKLKTDNASV